MYQTKKQRLKHVFPSFLGFRNKQLNQNGVFRWGLPAEAGLHDLVKDYLGAAVERRPNVCVGCYGFPMLKTKTHQKTISNIKVVFGWKFPVFFSYFMLKEMIAIGWLTHSCSNARSRLGL